MLAQPARSQVDRAFVGHDFGLSIWCLWRLWMFVGVCGCLRVFVGVCGRLRVFVAALRTLPGSSWRIVGVVGWPEHRI